MGNTNKWALRAETGVLVVILFAVFVFAGAAAFTHVHDWTMANSPAGTGDWFGWANAVISELVPIASLLVMRRRRRAGENVVYAASLLVLALALSITAQLAMAKPTFTGGLVSVVPALAFAALAKLVLAKTTVPGATEASVPETNDDRSLVPDLVAVPVDALNPELIERAALVAAEHRETVGREITRDELRERLRIKTETASQLLPLVRPSHSGTVVNGRSGDPLIGVVTR